MLILSICSPLEVNVEKANPAAQAWECLRGKIAAEILVAPKTGGDPYNAGDWPSVPLRVVDYLERNIVVLHTRFKALFQALELEEMVDWDATQYIPGQSCPI